MIAIGADTRGELLVATATLRYGPVTLRFRSERPEVRLGLRYPHTLFRVGDDGPADVEVMCDFGDASPITGQRIFDANGVWELRRSATGEEQVYYPIRGRGGDWEPLMSITFDRSIRSARYVRSGVAGEGGVVTIGYPVDEYLSCRLLARRGGMILHACTVKDDRGAYVFLGHSGAGKSTIAAFASAAGAEVLTDDRTIVTVDEGLPIAWGTPWHGAVSESSSSAANIAAMFLLVQADREELLPMEQARAFSEAFVRMYQPTVDGREVLQVIDALKEVTERVPMLELHTRKSPAGFALARSVVANYLRACPRPL